MPQALLPEKRYLYYPNLAKAVGSDFLAARVAQLQPDLHLFGHVRSHLWHVLWLLACVAAVKSVHLCGSRAAAAQRAPVWPCPEPRSHALPGCRPTLHGTHAWAAPATSRRRCAARWSAASACSPWALAPGELACYLGWVDGLLGRRTRLSVCVVSSLVAHWNAVAPAAFAGGARAAKGTA